MQKSKINKVLLVLGRIPTTINYSLIHNATCSRFFMEGCKNLAEDHMRIAEDLSPEDRDHSR